MKYRHSYEQAIETLAFRHDKMAFLLGPRRVGKTTIGQDLIRKHPPGYYFNWDDVSFRRQWSKDPNLVFQPMVGEKPLLVLDELHKAPKWKQKLKGFYDLHHEHSRLLVTGSARFDTYRQRGDSLLGRYFSFRLHPFSLGEFHEKGPLSPGDLPQKIASKTEEHPKELEKLLRFGGFPEPYLKEDVKFLRIWQNHRTERLLREDLIDLSRAHDLAQMEALVALIPERVSSLFSYQSLAEILEVSQPTIKRWLEWLVQIYYLYKLPPYSHQISRSLRKQPKIYLWDWSEISNEGARFENLVAGHLLKACHFWTDTGEGVFDLFYLRDKEKREIDFLVTQNRKPWLLVECKKTDKTPSPALLYYSKYLKPALSLQVTHTSGLHQKYTGPAKQVLFLISADRFLPLLP